MNGNKAGMIGMIVGGLGILTAGLFDGYTETLLLCGSIVLSSGIIATAITSKTIRTGHEKE
ncbi:MAG: hypothetical protein KAH23_09470 [Kiritimatiellae bacterium]|nr:hypothetical protein [Kiritimatiellia bacterium]